MRGPRLPAGAGSPPSRFRCAAPGLSQSTGTPRVWVPGKLGSAGRGVCVCVWGGVPASRGAVRANAGPGSVRGRRRGSRGGQGGGRTSAERCAALLWGAGPRARPCCHPAAAEGRGHTHPGRPAPLPPALRTPEADGGPGRRELRRRSRAPGLPGVAVARAPRPGLPPAPRPRLPASPGAAADILRRAGGRGADCERGREVAAGSGRLADRPGFACDAPPSAVPQLDAWSHWVGLVAASPVSFIPALGRVPDAVSVCFSNSLPAFSAEASLSGSYLTTSRNCRSAFCPVPLIRGKISLFVCVFPPL